MKRFATLLCLNLSLLPAPAASGARIAVPVPFGLAVQPEAPMVSVHFATGGPVVPDQGNVVLCAEATGTPPPTLQWQFNGEDLPDQTFTCLGRGAISPSQAGDYTVVASNTFGSVTSAVVSVTVVLQPPTVFHYSVPTGSNVLAGTDVALCASVLGSLHPSQQWRFNGVDLIDQTNQCLALPQISLSQAGQYTMLLANTVYWPATLSEL